MKRYSLYIFDLDGTIYRGDEALPGALEAVTQLQADGAQIRYLTNNSGRTQEFYADKLRRMGFSATPSEVYSSALGAAKLCAERGYENIFFVGNHGLRETLEQFGLSVTDSEILRSDAVVAGICHSFTFDWMNAAMQQIRAGAEFIATNTDATYPMEGGREIPGAGSIVAAIATCSGAAPFVVGKPNPFLVEMILKEAGVTASDALVVGDRYETDIVSGLNAGTETHLVLTGVTKAAPEGQNFSPDLLGLLDQRSV